MLLHIGVVRLMTCYLSLLCRQLFWQVARTVVPCLLVTSLSVFHRFLGDLTINWDIGILIASAFENSSWQIRVINEN